MNLAALLSTSERLRLLEAVLFTTGRLSVNSVAQQTHLSKSLVSRYLEALRRAGMGQRQQGQFVVTTASPLVKSLRILLNITMVANAKFHRYPFVKAVGLYGSGAKGENTEESDLDLWIHVGPVREETLARMTAALRHTLKRVNLLILSEARLRKLKSEDPLFYHALSFGSFVVYGDPHGLEA